MQRKVLPIIAISSILLSFFNSSCNKLDTTDIGSGLIPPVDNVNTFETTLDVNSTAGLFNDSTLLASTDDYVLGTINDPIFGKTNATVFLELKPTVYPYYWGSAGDTVDTNVDPDSVVLCLAYKGFYGDSNQIQRVQVNTISNSVTAFKDSAYIVGRFYPAVNSTPIGFADINPLKIRDQIVFTNKKDSVVNQIRIRITDNNFIRTLFRRDSLPTSANNAFYNDSAFRSLYKGFAVSVDTNATSGPRGLFYVNLADENTRLEVHFKKKTAGTGVKDTIFNALRFNTTSSSTVSYSARTNYIRRNRTGAEFNPPSSLGQSSAVYIQTTPGSYANLDIPGLSFLSNRIIHRAELIMEQVPDPLNTLLVPPSFLYLDVIDTPNVHWKPLPFDLSPTEAYSFYPNSGGIDFINFGGYLRHKTDPNNAAISMSYYNFNISRYVQHIVNNHNLYPNYKLRLYAPFQLNYPEFFFGPVAFSNSIAFGRVKLGSGTNPNYKMRLHIVYSNI